MKDDIFKIEQKSLSYYSQSREEILSFVPVGVEKVLEIGCGDGIFGRSLRAVRSTEVWGVEMCEKAAMSAKVNLDKVIIGNIETDAIDLPESYFDCIIFNDVLEHLRYPWIILKEIVRHLASNGYIVASIPNVRYLDNIKKLIRDKDWKYTDEGILDKTHLRFFTEKSIRKMFELCGYNVLQIEGINPAEFYWKFKLLNWVMNKRFDDMKYLRFACVAQCKKL